jgi:hypothetical protein
MGGSCGWPLIGAFRKMSEWKFLTRVPERVNAGIHPDHAAHGAYRTFAAR